MQKARDAFETESVLLGFTVDSVKAEFTDGRGSWFVADGADDHDEDDESQPLGGVVLVVEEGDRQELLATLRKRLTSNENNVDIVITAYYELPKAIDFTHSRYSELRQEILLQRAQRDLNLVFSSVASSTIGLLGQIPGEVPFSSDLAIIDMEDLDFSKDAGDEAQS